MTLTYYGSNYRIEDCLPIWQQMAQKVANIDSIEVSIFYVVICSLSLAARVVGLVQPERELPAIYISFCSTVAILIK